MKKKLFILVILIGIIASVIGMIMKIKNSFATSIIGGADGPTTIFLAGKLGPDFSLAFIIAGIIMVIIAIALLMTYKIMK